jgi:hypothetical protein
MDLPRLFRRDRLSITWRHDVAGVLWRLVPDHDACLIGEVRDPEAKSVSLFRIDSATGALRWTDVHPPGGWWSGIECVTPGALLLHGFASPDLPGHRGLTALDIRSGATLWSDEELVFVAAADAVAYGLRGRPDRRMLVGRMIMTGVAVSEDPADDARLLGLTRRWQGEAVPRCALPVPAPPGEVGPAPGATAGREAGVAASEELRMGRVLITAQHVREAGAPQGSPSFTRVLTVSGPDAATPLFREVLDEHLTVTVPEAFLAVGRMLLFVRERRTLCGVRLPDAAGEV